MCGLRASSSSERSAEGDLNQNKMCLVTEFYEEDDKLQPFHKEAMFLLSNINKNYQKL